MVSDVPELYRNLREACGKNSTYISSKSEVFLPIYGNKTKDKFRLPFFLYVPLWLKDLIIFGCRFDRCIKSWCSSQLGISYIVPNKFLTKNDCVNPPTVQSSWGSLSIGSRLVSSWRAHFPKSPRFSLGFCDVLYLF